MRRARNRLAGLLSGVLALALTCVQAMDASPPPELPDMEAAADTVFKAAPMRLKVGDLAIPHPEFALFVMPGESLRITPKPAGFDYRLEHADGQVRRDEPYVRKHRDHAWTWTSPQDPGHVAVIVRRVADDQSIRLNIFVMVPSKDVVDGQLNGYRIGAYPDEPLGGHQVYLPPRGFVELTPALEQIRLSPHFRLGEFASRQGGGYPKYLVLDERLLLALEELIVAIRDDGLSASSLHVMSGFRTPYYNKAIGNVEYSLHQWGMAADVFVDEDPKDSVMDDLDGDGEITLADAARLYRIADLLQTQKRYRAYVGGTGLYGPAFPRRGPFIHVDVRGWRARW